jgi:hypothetical protein
MIARIDENGLLIPKQMLGDAKEAEIHTERGRIVVVLDPKDDPIWRLGEDPITVEENDVSVNLDKYLYDGK